MRARLWVGKNWWLPGTFTLRRRWVEEQAQGSGFSVAVYRHAELGGGLLPSWCFRGASLPRVAFGYNAENPKTTLGNGENFHNSTLPCAGLGWGRAAAP